MNLFLIKKTFFDMWDNMLRIVLLNIGFLVTAVLFFYIPYLLRNNIILFITGMSLCLILFNVYYGTVSLFVLRISDYESPGFSDFFIFLKKSWLISILYSIIIIIVLITLIFILPFYLRLKNYLGFFIFFFFLWITAIFFLSIQFFYPIYGRFNNRFGRILKKCLIMFFDNIIFSIYLVIGSIVILGLSIITGFIFPGVSTLLLWLNDGFKLRMYKYDYQDENPEADRKKIPWDTLLEKDREMVGHRTFKNTIFPWRE